MTTTTTLRTAGECNYARAVPARSLARPSVTKRPRLARDRVRSAGGRSVVMGTRAPRGGDGRFRKRVGHLRRHPRGTRVGRALSRTALGFLATVGRKHGRGVHSHRPCVFVARGQKNTHTASHSKRDDFRRH